MTAAEFKQTRQALGLTHQEIAPFLGLGNKARISEIECGKKPISKQVALLMTAYASGYRPIDWPTP